MKKILAALVIAASLWMIALTINTQNDGQVNGPSEKAPSADQHTGGDKQTVEEAPRIGFRAPGFELQALDGKVYSLKDIGKPVVLNFWASWCGPCRIEAPALMDLYTTYQGQLEIYAINLTDTDSVESARQFADEYQFSFPVLLDMDGQVGNTYQVQAVPTTYFVDEKGMIVDQVIGFASPEHLEEQFRKLVKGK
jgi:cytochrome c biogenesis protein CcmG/thiol:disulfide interchange protein DsbE